jgi:prophage regulatory protein
VAQEITRELAILRLKNVKLRTGMSRSFIYAAMKRGEFPAKVALGARSVGWVEEEVEGYLRARVQASRVGAVK